jgi:hypothetical protein
LRNYIHLQALELKMQAALGIFNLSAVVFIMFAVGKRISSSEEDDQMAPPFGNLPPLKRWAKLFTFVLICADFFTGFFNLIFNLKRAAAFCAAAPF